MQLSSHVHTLRIPFTVFAGPVALERFVYAYALVGDRVWLVDTGVSGSASRLLGLVADTGRSQADVSDILLTHSHVDHIGSAKALVGATSANVHAHPAERRWIEDVACQAKERPVPGFAQLCDAGVAVTHALADGQRLELGPALHAHVIATPGHSPGSVSYFIEEQGVLITGDAVPVKGDMPVYDDPVTSIRSIVRLQALRGVHTLSSAWDEPRSGNEVAEVLAAGIQVIQGVHAAVRAATTSPETDAMGFCKEVVQRLKLPAPFVNPMCLRTFLGHWKARGGSLAELVP
jgi:glyoxylase-like metal-dependent hydrolase (beta-lactamase superfamily II)